MDNFPSLNGKIEIHVSQCNLRCRAINILKYFEEWTHRGLKIFWKLQVVNTVKWHCRHGVFNHGQLDSVSNRLFRLTTKQTQKLHIPEFCGNHLSSVVSPHKWVGDAGIVIDITSYSTHYGAIWWHKSVNTDSGNGLLLDRTKSLPEPVLTYHR